MGIPAEERVRLERVNASDPKGASALKDETPQHEVNIKDFSIMKTEVTVSEYKACVQAGACNVPPHEEKCTFHREDSDDLPVNCVSWFDAEKFCAFIHARLPSEAEWEFAGRSRGKYLRFPWGEEPEPNCELAVIDRQGRGCGRHSLWPVCSKKKGNTEQGLCDMAGNAWEWVQDWFYPDYQNAPNDGSARLNPIDSNEAKLPRWKVMRGGGIGSFNDFRMTVKAFHPPNFNYGGLSFRCAED